MDGPAADAGSGSVRLRLDLGYDGTDFSGWAVQPGRRTVEGVLAGALGTVLRLEGVRLTVAGRTDAGVHATGQVAHVDVPLANWRAFRGRSTHPREADLLRRLAGVLPPDLRVAQVSEAPAGFEARFSAIWRRYRYRVSDDPSGAPPLRRHDVLAYRRPLDAEAMDAAAANLLGLHDFAAFCKRREGATTIRTLLGYTWQRNDDGLLVATVVADAFCHSMVRALVGAVLAVGEGHRAVEWPAQVLTGRSRHDGVRVARPHGLVLEHVEYPPEQELATRAGEARTLRTL
jgi:tRNA pseudouridine38-40 synthase